MTRTYAVSYEGWLIIEAETATEAGNIANQILSDSGIINNGATGEWMLAEIEEEEY